MTELILTKVKHGTAEYQSTVDLRYKVLRKPLGLTYTPDALAAEADSIHIACHLGDKLVGCLILKPQGETAMQMRQVAVDEGMQGKGIGRALVQFSEEEACKNTTNSQECKIWLHARETAVAFYERLGYTRDGEKFEEVGIPHWFMYKVLYT